METVDQENIPPNIEEQLNRAYRELNVLYEISCAMRTTLELEHILYIILTGVTSHTGLGYNRALLFLVNQKLKRLECKMAIGPDSGEHANKIWQYIEKSRPDMEDLIREENVDSAVKESTLYKSLKETTVPLDDQTLILSQAYKRATPWHIPQETIPQYAQDPLFRNFKTTELVIMPLRAKGAVNGLIIADNLYTQKPITSDDIRIFTMLADQAGLAIENSQLYEMVVQKSHTDALTNLWNHGYFQEQLAESLSTAAKNRTPVSLAIIDIDNFKHLNDVEGHQTGDVILKELARLLQDSSRETDIVCRYGGEEIAIIFTQTSKGQSFDTAERIRRRIEQHIFRIPLTNKEFKITVSIGLATFPDDVKTKEELIEKADKAMYIAKFSGKNKTCFTE